MYVGPLTTPTWNQLCYHWLLVCHGPWSVESLPDMGRMEPANVTPVAGTPAARQRPQPVAETAAVGKGRFVRCQNEKECQQVLAGRPPGVQWGT